MFETKYFLFSLIIVLCIWIVDTQFCSDGRHKCNITQRECSSISCLLANSHNWRYRNCIGCPKSNGTKIVWTYKNNSSLPPNLCIRSSEQFSFIILPPCFVNKQLNEGKYTCTTINITSNEITRPPKTFDMVVRHLRYFSTRAKEHQHVNITCPYNYCVEKYTWSYSKTADGIYGTLPHGISAFRSYILIRQMKRDLAGYYKCTAKTRNLKPISTVTRVKLNDYIKKKSTASFTFCSQQLCAPSRKHFDFMCKGNISNGDTFKSELVSLSCPLLRGIFLRTFERSSLTAFIRNERGFMFEGGGIQFKGVRTSFNVFEIHFRIRRQNDMNGSVACNLTLGRFIPGIERRQFTICFYEIDLTSLILSISIPISVAVVILAMILLYRRWEYEIRLLAAQDCPFYRSKTTNMTRHKVLLIYAKDRESFAENLKMFLTEKINGILVRRMWDSIPGEDVSSAPTKAICDSSVVIILLEKSAFDRQPSLFEDVLKLSYDNNHIPRMYIVLDKGKFLPPKSFKAAKVMKADMGGFRARDRVVEWHEPLEDNVSCQDTLLKKLRLCLVKQSGHRERTLTEVTWASSLTDMADFMQPIECKLSANNSAAIDMIECSEKMKQCQ